mgnify:CR=1 FL=1
MEKIVLEGYKDGNSFFFGFPTRLLAHLILTLEDGTQFTFSILK